jgi:SAM-dependent methyltransferase
MPAPDVVAFVRGALPPAPARVLEVGCGEGDLARAVDAAGYEVLAIDPEAPEGAIFRQTTIEELGDTGPFDAVVAVRMLHHVHPLGAALDKLAALAPRIVVDEFAPERIEGPTQDWYEGQYRLLVAAGHEPAAPASLDVWREKHSDLHESATLLAALEERYERRSLEWVPYLYRWLRGPATMPLEQTLVDAGLIRPVGYRFVGERRPVSTR